MIKIFASIFMNEKLHSAFSGAIFSCLTQVNLALARIKHTASFAVLLKLCKIVFILSLKRKELRSYRKEIKLGHSW